MNYLVSENLINQLHVLYNYNYLQPLDSLDNNLLLFNFSLHQHGPEVHPALHGDVELEAVLHLAVLIAQHRPVVALVIRPGLVAAEGDGVVLPIGPELVPDTQQN